MDLGLVLVLLLILVLPFPIQRLSYRSKPFTYTGAVINCFIAGFILAQILPSDLIEEGMKKNLQGVMVPIGICCMLFCTDIKQWLQVSAKVMLGFGLAIVATLSMVFIMFWLKGDTIDDGEAVSGMLTGSYIGGTPNMAAIHSALERPIELYTTMFISDVIASTIYLVVIFVFAKRFLKFVLRPFQKSAIAKQEELGADPSEAYYQLPWPKRILPTFITIGLACACTAISLGIIWLKEGNLDAPDLTLMYVLLTLLGVTFAMFKPIRSLPGNFETGDYLFCMFFFALGLFTTVDMLQGVDPNYLIFTFYVLFGSMFVHIALCWFFRIDRDTMMITSVAAIMSPPFIPSVASSLKNRELLVPGITVGIVGLAVGNLLGLSVARFLATWL